MINAPIFFIFKKFSLSQLCSIKNPTFRPSNLFSSASWADLFWFHLCILPIRPSFNFLSFHVWPHISMVGGGEVKWINFVSQRPAPTLTKSATLLRQLPAFPLFLKTDSLTNQLLCTLSLVFPENFLCAFHNKPPGFFNIKRLGVVCKLRRKFWYNFLLSFPKIFLSN